MTAVMTVAGRVEDHERLFVGPGRVPCPPYESAWVGATKGHGGLMGAPAQLVLKDYEEAGLRFKPEMRDLPDHVAMEWEAVGYCAAQGLAEPMRRLLAAHLAGWMPDFCAAVEGAGTHPWYPALGRLTAGWTAALVATLPQA